MQPTATRSEDYHGIFESSNLVMLLIDPETAEILDANQSAANFYGWSISELKSKLISDLNILPISKIRLKMQAANELKQNRFLLQHRLANGDIHDIEAFSGPVNVKGRIVLCSIIVDVSKQCEIQRSLDRSEELFRDAFENSMTGKALPSLDGRFNRVNDSLCKMLGYEKQVLEAMTLQETVHADERNQVEINLEKLVSRQVTALCFERRYLRANGEVMWAEVRAMLLTDSKNFPLHFIMEINDISLRKKAEHERDHLQSQLIHSQKMEAIGQLAGGVAHDFNNLLSVILGYSELLLQAFPQENPHHESISEVYGAAERAKNLTRQLLAFSRKQILQLTTIPLNSVVTGFKNLLQRIIGEQILLEIQLTEKDPLVMIDISQIEQVLMNLVINARDAMPKGGKIVIETGIKYFDEKIVANKFDVSPGLFASISISDTGVGMDKATLEKIFEPFFTTKGPDHGTGLGLSTAYGIIKQHGGHIWAYSEPGRGTSFSVFLPISESSTVTTPVVTAPTGASNLSRTTVLVAEDDELVRRLVEKILTKSGCRVLLAKDAKTAISIAKQQTEKIDLLLTDMIMPGMDGPELHKTILSLFPQIKVLFMSGYSPRSSVFLESLQDPDSFIQKPISVRPLLDKIKLLLNKDFP